MEQLSLIVCLNDDRENTLLSKVQYAEKQQKKKVLERDGVILLSDNAILVDRTIAHGTLAQVCTILEDAKWPFLLVRMDRQELLTFGIQNEDVLNFLSNHHVSSVPNGGNPPSKSRYSQEV
jgi:hypothetical protein